MKSLYKLVLHIDAYPDGDFVVWASPDRLGISMEGGPGLKKALSSFVSYAEDLADMLTEDEGRLGPGPAEQLAWLRAHGFAKKGGTT